MKPNKVIYLRCTGDSFYNYWIEFLAPFHKLAARERDVAARIFAQYAHLKQSVKDPELLRELLWSTASRTDMRESLGISQAHFQMVLAKLKKVGIIVNGDLNPRYIPPQTDDPRFMLSIVFDWSDSANRISPKNDEE